MRWRRWQRHLSRSAALASGTIQTEPNIPPTLDPIGNKTVNELTLMSFTATSSDPDLPAQPLTYSLTGAPSGASIGATTGEFTWTPTEAQGPGTPSFQVCVSDGVVST